MLRALQRGLVRRRLSRGVGRLSLQLAWVLVAAILAGCTGGPEKVAPETIAAPSATPSSAPTTSPTSAGEGQPVSIAGTWVGGFQLPGGPASEQMVSITFSESAGQAEGAITYTLDDKSRRLDAVRWQGGMLHFELAPGTAGADAATFDGRVSGHTIEGTVQEGGRSAPFTFVRNTEPAEGEYVQLAGTYRFPSGRAIGFYQTSGPQSQVFDTWLLFADLQTGDLAAVFPVSGTTFVVGSAVSLAFPFKGEVTFVRDASGAIDSLRWSEKGQPDTVAEKVGVRTEEMSYPGEGGINLKGRLTTPDVPGKRPTVMIVHGAGKVGRQSWLTDLLGGLFALDGIATFSYDKRGVGDSGGEYGGGVASQELIELLGKDALAGVEYLKGRDDIDPARIGMLGQSQAGWIIPFAAAQSKDVAFMVLWSGPGVTQGISDLYDRIAETAGREEITQTLLSMGPLGFDPLPYLEKSSAPGLWIYGDRDMTVPVPESIANLEKVKAAGQKDFTWQTFPGADHYMFRVASLTGDDLRVSPGYPPGMLDGMMRWVRQRVAKK